MVTVFKRVSLRKCEPRLSAVRSSAERAGSAARTIFARIDVGQDAVFGGDCTCHQIASLRSDGLVSRRGEVDPQYHESRIGPGLDYVGGGGLPLRLARIRNHPDNG